ncbi:MAG: hypothetical protein NTW21_27370 [Verrucomicrobia bacterium]|nr:hypothetical protein [Verrucomicrobiota bacterium]
MATEIGEKREFFYQAMDSRKINADTAEFAVETLRGEWTYTIDPRKNAWGVW